MTRSLCNKDLPPQSSEVRICSYECTYCADCVDNVLHNVCPTCGGGFTPRPIRPMNAWRPDKSLGLINHPASTTRVHSKYACENIEAHVARIRHLAPQDR